MTAPRNLVNLSAVAKGYGARSVLRDVSLGVAAGDRTGVVGRNGDGKSTLLRLIAGAEEPDAGTVVRTGRVSVALLGQGDSLRADATVREELVGGRADHEWRADPAFRDVLAGLLGGVELRRLPSGLDSPVAPLSGGERRRVALAALLLGAPELLLLDEPTNHLDVEGVDWLARHLAGRRGAMLVVTHDRWFLDAVCTATWEVVDEGVQRYDGGYAAFVLARAERARVAAVREERRQAVLRKELAWLRRGPPARTAKPKFRIEAANALIADEPQPRDSVELLRFSTARLGNQVLEAEGASVSFGSRAVLRDVTWRLGPGDRVALVGVNGSGKTTLLRVLAGALAPDAGTVDRGATVRLAYLAQDALGPGAAVVAGGAPAAGRDAPVASGGARAAGRDAPVASGGARAAGRDAPVASGAAHAAGELSGDQRVLESLEAIKRVARLGDGRELTAGALAERFGFGGDRARTLVRELSGGERRRLQLMRLLMGEPNVLLLDEPTNDLDIDTLTALEDLLDGWPGTLVVVSHDRYFVERVCDNVYALSDRGIRHLPGGIDQYVAERRTASEPPPAPRASEGPPAQAVIRAARKEAARLERALERVGSREASLHEAMAEAATDHVRLRELQAELAGVAAERETLEAAWLEAAEALEG